MAAAVAAAPSGRAQVVGLGEVPRSLMLTWARQILAASNWRERVAGALLCVHVTDLAGVLLQVLYKGCL